jgi:predicted nucleic acid-binding protein
LSSYFDTSFLVSLYSVDANSALAIRSLRAQKAPMRITAFTEFEFVNALSLRVFRKEISTEEAQASRDDFELDLRQAVLQLYPLPENVFRRAQGLSRQYTARLGTRAGDLLHVAAALELGSDTFLSFDRQQRKLAQAVKLKLNAWP